MMSPILPLTPELRPRTAILVKSDEVRGEAHLPVLASDSISGDSHYIRIHIPRIDHGLAD